MSDEIEGCGRLLHSAFTPRAEQFAHGWRIARDSRSHSFVTLVWKDAAAERDVENVAYLFAQLVLRAANGARHMLSLEPLQHCPLPVREASPLGQAFPIRWTWSVSPYRPGLGTGCGYVAISRDESGGYRISALLADGTRDLVPRGLTVNDWLSCRAGRMVLRQSPLHGCEDYVVVDTRGSEAQRTDGLSPPGAAFIDALRKLTPGRKVRVVKNSYRASGGLPVLASGLLKLPFGYHTSVVEGENWLRTFLKANWLDRRCRDPAVFLTGYSQGAQIVGNVFAKIVKERGAGRIVGAALFGDPLFNPADKASARGGPFDPRLHGALGRRAPYPSAAYGRVRSYCHAGRDYVCQLGGAGPIKIAALARQAKTHHANYHLGREPEEALLGFSLPYPWG